MIICNISRDKWLAHHNHSFQKYQVSHLRWARMMMKILTMSMARARRNSNSWKIWFRWAKWLVFKSLQFKSRKIKLNQNLFYRIYKWRKIKQLISMTTNLKFHFIKSGMSRMPTKTQSWAVLMIPQKLWQIKSKYWQRKPWSLKSIL